MTTIKVEFINTYGDLLSKHILFDDTSIKGQNYDWGTICLLNGLIADIPKENYTFEVLNQNKSCYTIELNDDNEHAILSRFYGGLILLAKKFNVVLSTENFNIYW
jgi:hypothetical protein